jgi:hypothetical protein
VLVRPCATPGVDETISVADYNGNVLDADEPVSGAVIGEAGAGLVVVDRPIRAVAPNPRKHVNPDRDRLEQLDLLH